MLRLLRQSTTLTCLLFVLLSSAHGPIHEKIERVNKKIAKNPNNAELYVERGEYYKIDRNFDQAFADYQHARNLNANLVTLDFLIAELFLDFDHYYSALQSANAFQKLNVNTAECYLLKAKIFDKLFEADSALYYAEASYPLQTKPSSHFFITIKNYCLYAHSDDYEKAKSWLLEGKKRLKSNMVIQEALVDLALRFNQINDAEAFCLEQIPKLRRKEYWYYKLALVYQQGGDLDRQKMYTTKALTAIDKLPRQHKNTSYIKGLREDIYTIQKI